MDISNPEQPLGFVQGGIFIFSIVFWFTEKFALTRSKPIFVIPSQESWKAEHFVAL